MPSLPWAKRGGGAQQQMQQQQQQSSYQHDRAPTLPNLVMNEDSSIYDDDRRDSSSSYGGDAQRSSSIFDSMSTTASRWYRPPSQMRGKVGHGQNDSIGGEEYSDPAQTNLRLSVKTAPRKSLKTRLAGAFASRENLSEYANFDETSEAPSRKRSVLRKGQPPSSYKEPEANPAPSQPADTYIDQEPRLPRIPGGSFSEGVYEYDNNHGGNRRTSQRLEDPDRLGPNAWVQSNTPSLGPGQQPQMQARPATRQQGSYTPPASTPNSHIQTQQFTSLTGNRPASRLGLEDDRPSSPGRVPRAQSPPLTTLPSRQRKDPLGGPRQPGQIQSLRPATTSPLSPGTSQFKQGPPNERPSQQSSAISPPTNRTQLARGGASPFVTKLTQESTNVVSPLATPTDDIREFELLRTKYIRVKKAYFQQNKQLEQLQDTVAQQNLSESRTVLDDGEYTRRLESLDGSIGELAFSIRKHWKELPAWIEPYVSEDAIDAAGKEMIAVGRAFVSRWLHDEIFDKHFHPGLPIDLSLGLKQCHRALLPLIEGVPSSSTAAEAQLSTLKRATAWRLATIDGLATMLSPKSATTTANTTTFASYHAESLHTALTSYLHESSLTELRLNASIAAIIDAATKILTNIPMESREVRLAYYEPKTPLGSKIMKVETGLPPVITAEGLRKRALSKAISVKSAIVNEGKDEDFEDANETSGKSTDADDAKETDDDGDEQKDEDATPTSGPSDPVESTSSVKQQSDTQDDVTQPSDKSAAFSESEGQRIRMAVSMGLQVRGKTGTESRVLVQSSVYLL